MKLNVPTGGIIGAMIFTGIFNITTSNALAPLHFKLFAQSIAGAYIAMPLTWEKIKSMRRVLLPAGIVVIGMFIASIIMAYVCVNVSVSNMDLITAFFLCAPGGMSDIVLISDEIGASTMQVSIGVLVKCISKLGRETFHGIEYGRLLKDKYVYIDGNELA